VVGGVLGALTVGFRRGLSGSCRQVVTRSTGVVAYA